MSVWDSQGIGTLPAQMEKARGAEELLGACLAALSDDAGSVGARERLGLLPDNGHDDRKRDAQAVHAALLQVRSPTHLAATGVVQVLCLALRVAP